MEIIAVLSIFGLVFGAIMAFGIWRVWRKFRMIAVAIPAGTDPQAFRYKLTEVIRALGYRENAVPGPTVAFRAPNWQKWAVGLQDILVEPAPTGAVIVTGPAVNVSRISRVFSGAATQPYSGRQPVLPLFKGFMRLFAAGLILTVGSILAAYLAGVK
jgi:hypothetical protein